jgi:hypothetical protein
MRFTFALKTHNMYDRGPHTSGQVFAPQDVEGLAVILSVSFLRTQVRESSHYTNGRYVRIDFPSQVEFFFERISEEEYLIRGEGVDSQLLRHAAEEIANCFGAHGLRCRFETYAEDDSLVAYAHHDWPLQDESEANKTAHPTAGNILL